jgi:hypothetical protein
MWQNLNEEERTGFIDIRKRLNVLVQQDPEVFTFILNYFFRWRGVLNTEAERVLHNAGEEFYQLLMGPKDNEDPSMMDDRYVDQFVVGITEIGGVDAKPSRPSGLNEDWHDKPRKRGKNVRSSTSG